MPAKASSNLNKTHLRKLKRSLGLVTNYRRLCWSCVGPIPRSTVVLQGCILTTLGYIQYVIYEVFRGLGGKQYKRSELPELDQLYTIVSNICRLLHI